VIGVVGGANVDYVIRVNELPAPGATIIGEDFHLLPGGKGANQACASAQLGATTRFFATVGSDAAGDLALTALRQAGVDTSHVRHSTLPTGSAFITVDHAGENTIVVSSGANQELLVSSDDVTGCDIVVTQLETRPDLIFNLIRSSSVPIVLNAAPQQSVPSDVAAKCRAIIVNEVEVATIALDACPLVVVTLGAKGAALYEHGRLVTTVTPPAVDAIDTVGAGDVFCSAFAVRLAFGDSADDALRYAVIAGALATTANGAQGFLPTIKDVEKWLDA
jgi:ribokinase